MILGVKGLTLSTQKCKWTPAKDRERNRDRKLGKVKGGVGGGGGPHAGVASHLWWEGSSSASSHFTLLKLGEVMAEWTY